MSSPREHLLRMAKLGGIAVRQKSIKAYYAKPNFCKQCRDMIHIKDGQKASDVKKKVFCSHSCSARFNNVGKIRNRRKDRVCFNCDTVLNKCQIKFCSSRCSRDLKWNIWCQEVERNGCFDGYDYRDVGGSVRKPKKFLLIKQGGRCSICGIKEWMGQSFPSVLDHVDGDANNWKVENVRVICRNCDGLLPTYCGKNRNKSTRRLQMIMKKPV